MLDRAKETFELARGLAFIFAVVEMAERGQPLDPNMQGMLSNLDPSILRLMADIVRPHAPKP